MITDKAKIALIAVSALAPLLGVISGGLIYTGALAVNAGYMNGFVAGVNFFHGSVPALLLFVAIGWGVALPGMALLGYPALWFFRRHHVRSVIVFGLAGAFLGSIYLGTLAAIGRFSVEAETGLLILALGAALGLLTALAARWAMTWRWLQC